MTAELLKTSGWTIAAAVLFLLAFLSPLVVAPLLLIWSLVAGLLRLFPQRMGRSAAGGDNYFKRYFFGGGFKPVIFGAITAT